MQNNRLRIAIQSSGRLNGPSVNFLKALGLKFPPNGRKLINPCTNYDADILYLRGKDIPEYVSRGVADFGIVGQNVLIEKNLKIGQIKNLGFGKCKLAIAVPKKSKIRSVKNLEWERIATSYPNILKKYLSRNQINAAIIPISRSVEAAPSLNLADAICDLVQTGKTLKENNLKVIDILLESEAILIESPSIKPEKQLFKKLLDQFDISKIQNIFKKIPSRKILKIAKGIQKKLNTDKKLTKKKTEDGSFVTKADIDIQKIILEYFSKSELTGAYSIKAEEETSAFENPDSEYQLIVDPLDGTSSFINQKDTWGVMIGICDQDGVLKYSWNLLSNGNIYQTSDKPKKILSFKEKIKSGKKIAIDVYDYKNGSSKKFGSVFEKISGIKSDQYVKTSYSAAIWAGWQLFNGKLDGLLWLPSDKGKKFYPDYDLIFLGALASIGFKIRLGKIDDKNAIVAIASSNEDVEILYQTGLKLVSDEQKKFIKLADDPLQITNNLNL